MYVSTSFFKVPIVCRRVVVCALMNMSGLVVDVLAQVVRLENKSWIFNLRALVTVLRRI